MCDNSLNRDTNKVTVALLCHGICLRAICFLNIPLWGNSFLKYRTEAIIFQGEGLVECYIDGEVENSINQ